MERIKIDFNIKSKRRITGSILSMKLLELLEIVAGKLEIDSHPEVGSRMIYPLQPQLPEDGLSKKLF